MSRPIVSVIIPCLNAARWIGETLESVTSQGVYGTEVIVVDDGSTDQSPNVVRKQFPQVQLIESVHGGASRARNIGTEASSGEFIQYLDADDLLMPGKLRAQIESLQRSGAGIAYGDWRKLIQRPDGQFAAGDVVSRKIQGEPEIMLFLANFWCPPAVYLFRREIVLRVGGWNENLPIIQDARFALDCVLRGGRFEYTQGIMAAYRVQSSDSLSRRDPIGFARDCFTNALEIKQWWEANGGINENRRKALLQAFGYVARGSFDKNSSLFENAVNVLEELKPHYTPDTPLHLAMASRILGYRRAESVALRYRQAKKNLKKFAGRNRPLTTQRD